MTEPRLFRTVYGYQLTLRLTRHGTWTLIMDWFYEGEPWSERDREVYEGLNLYECIDVLLEELSIARA